MKTETTTAATTATMASNLDYARLDDSPTLPLGLTSNLCCVPLIDPAGLLPAMTSCLNYSRPDNPLNKSETSQRQAGQIDR
jgi:hypothetical protein